MNLVLLIYWFIHLLLQFRYSCLHFPAATFPCPTHPHLPFSISLHFADIFYSCAEAFYFDEVSFVYFFLYVPCSRGHIGENITAWNIWDFLPMFSSRTFMVSQFIFKSFYPSWVYFWVRYRLVVEFHFFACSCPNLPTPFVKEAIFIPFYTSVLFAE